MDRFLRIGEVAKLLCVSVGTLRRWEREGKLIPHRIGKQRRYSYEQVMEFLGAKKEN
jgi:putative resolvase